MKISYNWLKEYTDCSLTDSEAANKLTLTGLEVEELETTLFKEKSRIKESVSLARVMITFTRVF